MNKLGIFKMAYSLTFTLTILLYICTTANLKAETGNSKNELSGLGDWPNTLTQAKSLIEYGNHNQKVGNAKRREGRPRRALYGINKVTLTLHPSPHSRLFTDKKYHGPLRSGWDCVINPLKGAGIEVLSDEKLHLIPACHTLCLYYREDTVQAALYKQVCLKRLPEVSFFDCVWWGMSEKHTLDKDSIQNKQISLNYIKQNSVEAINLLIFAWKTAKSSFKEIPSITNTAKTPTKDDIRAYAKNLIDNGNPIYNNREAYIKMGIRTLENLTELVLVIKPSFYDKRTISEGKLKEATQRLTKTLSQNGVNVLSTDQIEEVPGYTVLHLQYRISEAGDGQDRIILINVNPMLYQEVLAHKKPHINYYERTWLGIGDDRETLGKRFPIQEKTVNIEDAALALFDNAIHVFLRDLKLANTD